MPRSFPLLWLAALCLVSVPCLRSAEVTAPKQSLITAADLFNLKQVETPALSPDGKWVVYVLRSIEPKPDAKDDWIYRTQLWLAAPDGKTAPRALTFGSSGNANPTWSPDGKQIAFVRTVEKEKPQLYLLSLAGGEAMPLTKLENGASAPRWSPDGSKILFTSSQTYAQVRAALEKSEKPAAPDWSKEIPGRKVNDTANWAFKSADKDKPKGPDDEAAKKPATNPDGTLQEIREWLAKNEADNNPRVTDRLNFLAEGDLAVDPNFPQFYVVDAREGAEPKPITQSYAGFANAEWLRDGQTLIAVGPRKLDEHPDRSRETSLYTIDVASGAAKVFLANAEENYGNPTPSPDGQWIAFSFTPGGIFSFNQPKVALIPVNGGEIKVLTASLDRAVQNLKWASNSASIYFTVADQGQFPLYQIPLDRKEIWRVTHQAEWGVQDYDVAAGTLVQVVTHPKNPWELYASTPDGKIAKPLTTHNSAWLQERTLSAYQAHSFVNKGGLPIQYWVVKPANFDPAKKYPLLLNIHGGPTAMWGPGEASTWHEMQFFAARGYVVVFANPRGSGGYGKEFQRANYQNWGDGPSSDVLAAAELAAGESYVDRDRQVVTGGSYGGYLVAWIVSHDHRFKAAVAQRGVYDLATFYGEGNAWFLVPLYWGGYPWEKSVREKLNYDSPLTYVENIKTPLLIKHGDTDFRTGVIQSQILYKSLKQLGRDVEYVRYPRATHELSRSGEPKQRLDRLVRYEEFFRRYLGEN
ncbi:S9 family peptidase [Oleiharenicola lentus]|uniref:S9 family peptidase n=1 Tax=Oleiharenicola lentus TaxID=2508720 RepID=UPI003F67372F